MSPTKIYVCSQPNCNQTFTKFTGLKKHETEHARPGDAHTCKFPGCDFATLTKASFEIHYARHTGEQRYGCPHDCAFRTHNPSALTRHRKAKHGYVPPPRNARGGGVAAPSASDRPSSTQPSASSYQPHPNSQDPSFNVLYGPADTLDDFTMFTEPARTADGWTEGCMCPELMQRRPSEMLGYPYTHQY